MGIMYKLMKHKHCLEMDLAKRNERSHKKDKQITAEYIIELCKFLAEKSQRNKQKQHTELMEYNLNASVELEGIVEMQTANGNEMDNCVGALPLISLERMDSDIMLADVKQILTTNKSQTIVPVATITNTLPYQQDSSKKDILLKIRNQIFERKRQRQLASMQLQRIGGVWRPW